MRPGGIGRGLVVLAVGAVVCAAGATSADAIFLGNNPGIDRNAISTRGGANVQATGPLICASGERVSLRVTVSQPATKARARARWKRACTGAVQHWRVRAAPRGGRRYEPGPAKVCVLGKTRAANRLTDRQRWCRRVSVSGRF